MTYEQMHVAIRRLEGHFRSCNPAENSPQDSEKTLILGQLTLLHRSIHEWERKNEASTPEFESVPAGLFENPGFAEGFPD